MSSDSSTRGSHGCASMWIVRLVSLALIAVILLVFGRVWLSGVMGCARMFDAATYFDPDERSRMPEQTPIPPLDMFSDAAYDQVFPDLVEPTLAPDGYDE